MSDRQTEAARIARANEQSGALSALEVDGFPVDGPLCRLNGVYERGAADFENYRPAWSKRDSDGDGFLFFHSAEGWIFSDSPPGSQHTYLVSALARDDDDGAIPIDDRSTTWRIAGACGRNEVTVNIIGHTDIRVQDVLLARANRKAALTHHLDRASASGANPAEKEIDFKRVSDASETTLPQRTTTTAHTTHPGPGSPRGNPRGHHTCGEQDYGQHHRNQHQFMHSSDEEDQTETNKLVEHKYAVQLQSCIRGHCLRRQLRWRAQDPESTAPLRAFLGKAGLARLANYFIARGVQWETLLTLTPKRLGGHMFPHVDFKFTSPEAAAQFRWKPENTTGRVPWGLPVDERTRLGKALRAERAKIAGREKAAQDREDVARKKAEAAELRKLREKEIAEGRIREEKKRAHEREETLKLLQWKQREEAGAQQKDEVRKTMIMQLQGGIAAQELQRRNAGKARRAAAQAKEDARQAIEREELRHKSKRKAALSSLRVGLSVRVLPRQQLSQSLIEVGKTGRVNLRSASAIAPTPQIDSAEKTIAAAATVGTEYGLEKLGHANKFGTVEDIDPSDDTVLLRMPQSSIGDLATARTASVWFPIESLDTAAFERHTADRAAKSQAMHEAVRSSRPRQQRVAGVSYFKEGAPGVLQLPPLEQKPSGHGGRDEIPISNRAATRHPRVHSRRRNRANTPSSGMPSIETDRHTQRQHQQVRQLQIGGHTPRLEATEVLKSNKSQGKNSRQTGGPSFTLHGSAASRERVYAPATNVTMPPRRLPTLQLA